MTKLSEIRAWKEKWGYDDMAVMPGGRPMKQFAPDRAALDRLAEGLENDAAALRKKVGPFDLDGANAPTAMTEEESSKLLAQALALEEKAAKLRSRFENPATARLNELAGTLDEAASGKKDEASRKLGTLAGQLRTEAERIRLLDEAPDDKLVRAAADALRPTAADEADSLTEWADDLANPYDPAQGPLASSIADRVRGRDILDRTAAIDQVTNNIYSADRGQELAKLTGNSYLAQAFGMRAIKEETRNGQLRSGILFDNDSSSLYQRDRQAKGFKAVTGSLYTKNCGAVKDGTKLFFVNNKNIVAKLDGTFTPEWVSKDGKKYKKDYIETKTVAPGLYAIVMKDSVDEKFRTVMLEGSGCTPSGYQVQKAKSGDTRDPLTSPGMLDPRLDNAATLKRVTDSPGCKTLAVLPDTSPMQQSAVAAANMVTGLQAALAKLGSDPTKNNALKQNKLVGSALEKIELLMQTMPAYAEDVPRFSRLFDLLVDEVYLVLATCKPYGKADFQEAAGAMIEERAPTLTDEDMVKAGVKHRTAMLSSGMDGLSTAVTAAFAATGSKKLHLIDSGNEHSSNYFEIETQLLSGATMGPTGKAVGGPSYTPPVIMGTLNPSTPVKQAQPGAESGKGDASWTVATLIEKINAVLNVHKDLLTTAKPAVAIIDVTVERNGSGHEQEIDKIVADPTIKPLLKEGKLKLMLAKSYQKYPNLGAGKAMSGGLTVIGKGADDTTKEPFKTVAATELAEGMLPDPGNADPGLRGGYDESQIVTHFMTHERDVERNMLERAAKNAKFVRGFMPPDNQVTSPNVRFDEGLPFLILPKHGLEVNVGKALPKRMNVSTALQSQGLEERQSFGFQNSSCLTITDDRMRIGFGQESEEDLVEKLYAVTNLAAKPEPGGISVAGAKAKALAGAQNAMAQATTALQTRDPADDKGEAWRGRMIRVLRASGRIVAKGQDYLVSGSKPEERLVVPDIEKAAKTDLEKFDARLNSLFKDVETRVMKPRTTDPTASGKALAAALAVVGAMRRPTVTEPGLSLSTESLAMQAVPKNSDKRSAWTADAEQWLTKRGKPLPPKSGDGSGYPEALRSAVQATWIAEAEKELTKRGKKLPKNSGDASAYAEALRGALHDADDVNLMHAHVEKGWDGPGADKMGFEARYLPNIIASWANLVATNMNGLPGGPATVCELADTLIEEGLDDLSPEGQQRLLQRRIETSLQGRDPTGLKQDTEAMGKAAEAMPYREGPARLLTGPQLKIAAAKLTDDSDLKKLVAALSGPLDLATQCDALEQLAATVRDTQATRIAKQFIPVLRAKFEEAGKAYADPGTVGVPASLKRKFDEQFHGMNSPARSKERKRLEDKTSRTKEENERLDLLNMLRLINAEGPLQADRPEPPTAIGDIRGGSTAAADHGPQPMSKDAFEKLRGRFDGIARRVK